MENFTGIHRGNLPIISFTGEDPNLTGVGPKLTGDGGQHSPGLTLFKVFRVFAGTF
jgi:hypothetical protein